MLRNKPRIVIPLPVVILILVLAPALLYSGSLDGPPVFDDANIIDEITALHESLSAQFQLRWFAYYSLTWTWTHVGADIFWLRASNLALHIATSVALFALLRRLLSLTAPGAIQHGIAVGWIAFAAALIFAIHPIGVYGVAYLVQRSIVMATLFSLLAMLAYLRGLTREKPVWFLLSATCYFIAVFSKEHSVMVPAVILAMTVLIYRPTATLAKRIAPPFLLYAVIGGLVVWSTRGLLGHAYEPSGELLLGELFGEARPENAHALSVLTQSFLFFKYAFLWFVPNPEWMSIDIREPFAPSLVSWPYTLAFVIYVGYGFAALRLLAAGGEKGFVGFSMLFPWLLFAPEFSTVRIQEPFVLYRSYLWAPGFTALLALLLFRFRRPIATGSLAALAVVSLLASWDRLQSFSSNEKLWDDAARLVRDDSAAHFVERIYFNRGNAYLEARKYQLAVDDYTKAIAARPAVSSIHNNRGFAYLELRRPQEALADFDIAVAVTPKHGRAHIGRGISLEMMGDFLGSAAAFRRSCELGYSATCRKWLELLMRPQSGE